jgi:ADP-ribose pyrophosphatase YjhB (NUDIX family)
MHRLQQHVLQLLIMNPELRYAQIKPREVEGNLFMYHLKHLINDGLVEKTAQGYYCLSPQGKLYADKLSLQSLTPRAQPRIVTLMAVEDGEGRWLFYRRKRQPLINMVGFPYGKIHLRESVKSAAERELREKTGLKASLVHIGDGYATTFEGQDAVSEIMFHMFYGSNPQGDLIAKSKIGESFWAKPEMIKKHELMPNVSSLLKLVKKRDAGHRFWAELNHRL